MSEDTDELAEQASQLAADLLAGKHGAYAGNVTVHLYYDNDPRYTRWRAAVVVKPARRPNRYASGKGSTVDEALLMLLKDLRERPVTPWEAPKKRARQAPRSLRGW